MFSWDVQDPWQDSWSRYGAPARLRSLDGEDGVAADGGRRESRYPVNAATRLAGLSLRHGHWRARAGSPRRPPWKESARRTALRRHRPRTTSANRAPTRREWSPARADRAAATWAAAGSARRTPARRRWRQRRTLPRPRQPRTPGRLL